MTSARFLPILVPCDGPKCDGSVDGKPVQVVSFDEVKLLVGRRTAFDKKYGDKVPQEDQKRLRGFLNLVDAAQTGKETMVSEVVDQLATLPEYRELSDRIRQDPLLFVEKEINERMVLASIVLWRARSSGKLSSGIFCKRGMLDAVYVLMHFHIGLGKPGHTGTCEICGKAFDKKRGDRRKTCSDKCRQQAYRMTKKSGKLTGRRAPNRRRSRLESNPARHRTE